MSDQSDVSTGCIEQIILKWKRLKVQNWSLPIQRDTSRSSRGVMHYHTKPNIKGCKFSTTEQAFLEKGLQTYVYFSKVSFTTHSTLQWSRLSIPEVNLSTVRIQIIRSTFSTKDNSARSGESGFGLWLFITVGMHCSTGQSP